MINKENEVFNHVAEKLHNTYSNIYVIGAKITSTPPKFPAVSLVQSNNSINTQYSTFSNLENVVNEHYQLEVFSNLEEESMKEAQTMEITGVVSDAMCELGYIRTFSEQVANADASINRRVTRFEKSNVI